MEISWKGLEETLTVIDMIGEAVKITFPSASIDAQREVALHLLNSLAGNGYGITAPRTPTEGDQS